MLELGRVAGGNGRAISSVLLFLTLCKRKILGTREKEKEEEGKKGVDMQSRVDQKLPGA